MFVDFPVSYAVSIAILDGQVINAMLQLLASSTNFDILFNEFLIFQMEN
jgi:hypothetical protein